MNVAASASARHRHSRLAVFAGNGPILTIVGLAGKVGLLAVRTACQLHLSDQLETINE